MKSGILWKDLAPITALAVGVLMFAAGCATDGEPAVGGSSGAQTSSSMAAGKRLYFGRCTSCHSPEPVDYFTRDEWTSMVAHMRKRAKLTPGEEASLLVYLYANAADS